MILESFLPVTRGRVWGKHSCFLITSVHISLAITIHIVIPMLKKLGDVGSSWDVTSQYGNKNTFLISGQLFFILLATSHSRFGFYRVLWFILSPLWALRYESSDSKILWTSVHQSVNLPLDSSPQTSPSVIATLHSSVCGRHRILSQGLQIHGYILESLNIISSAVVILDLPWVLLQNISTLHPTHQVGNSSPRGRVVLVLASTHYVFPCQHCKLFTCLDRNSFNLIIHPYSNLLFLSMLYVFLFQSVSLSFPSQALNILKIFSLSDG